MINIDKGDLVSTTRFLKVIDHRTLKWMIVGGVKYTVK